MQEKQRRSQFYFLGIIVTLISLIPLVNHQVQARSGAVQAPLDDLTEEIFLPVILRDFGSHRMLWESSAHSDSESAAFTNWDGEGQIPTSCAKCHSTPGYLDFLGEDGTTALVVDNPAEVGTTIECDACHNDTAINMTSVTFHSGAVLTGLGRDASCMQCHQGHNSRGSVDAHISAVAGTDLDSVYPGLDFQDIHNQFVGDLLYGTWVQGGYEYEGQDYDAHFDHVAGASECMDCHNPHTLELDLVTCQDCHTGVVTAEDIKTVRRNGSEVDYDGDGSTSETIEAEIESLQAKLYTALRSYAGEFSTLDIAYTPNTAPYFFQDLNDDGIVEPGVEDLEANAYATWTGRMIRTAYNYHLSVRAPGAYIHGAKYLIQLLYDSIADLNTVISTPVPLSTANRVDAAHFNAANRSWRNWDDAGAVPADCSRCHSTNGYVEYILDADDPEDEPVSGGLNCEGCHDDLAAFTRHSLPSVMFANGDPLTLGSSDENLCLVCHQSRLSTGDVDTAISGLPLDTVDGSLTFMDPHNLATGSTLFGDDAQGMYQFPGKTYQDFDDHHDQYDEPQTCLDCHATHTLEVEFSTCSGSCHNDSSFRNIREQNNKNDYDGDGDDDEGIYYEVLTMHEVVLYDAIQAYATGTAGTAIVYSPEGDDFFYIDTNGNGDPDPDEIVSGNVYNTWTPSLLRVAYNYQYIAREPGAYVHQPMYVLQVLYDSIEDINGNVSGMTRP